MIRAGLTLLLLAVALLLAAVGIAGAAFMFSHRGFGPAVIGVIFAGALVLLAICVAFGAMAVAFRGPDPNDPTRSPTRDPQPCKEPCIMCRYDLSSLPRRGRCPECGFSYDLDDRAETFSDLNSLVNRTDDRNES